MVCALAPLVGAADSPKSIAMTLIPDRFTPALSADSTTLIPSAVRPVGSTGRVYQTLTSGFDCCSSLSAWLFRAIDGASATAAPSMSKSMWLTP